jgi:hypothetical protein
MVELAAHRPQTRLYVAQALAVSQLREGHRQVLVPAREASPVSITAITGHTLLKLVGGEVLHELSKNGLAGIHPSLSAIGQGARRGGFPPARAQKSSNRKIDYSSYRTDSTVLINFRKTLAGQQ